MELFKLFGKIVIENSEANEEIDETTKKASEASGSISGAFKKIGAAIGTFIAVDKIKDFGLGCITAAADANAASSQFSQVFGDLEGKASKSLSGIAEKAGISENRMKGSFTKIAAFAKTTGMKTEDALGLSERAMVAVADSAAFYDRSLEDTTESLQSFLKGNYENDAALGLSCTEVTRNEAANKLYGKSFKDLSESQKQLTLLKMVEDANKASGALGQAARESDTWSNVTGNLKQLWSDFQAKLGEKALPLAVGFVKTLAEKVTNLAEKVPAMVEWFQKYSGVLAGVAAAIGVVVAGIGLYNTVIAVKKAMDIAEVATLGALIKMKIASAAATVAAVAPYVLIVAAIAAVIAIGVLLYKNWDKVTAKCKEMWKFVTEKFSDLKNKVVSKVTELKDKAVDKFNSMKTSVVNKFNELKSNAIEKVNSLKSSVIDKFNSIKSGITEKINAAKDKVKEAIEKIKGFFNFKWSLPKIKLPHFSISGKFSLNPPSIPKFSVEWYKKAYDNPMLLNKPSIFGFNPATGKFMGGGDGNGTEIVAGKNTLMNMIRTASSEGYEIVAYYLQKIIEILASFFPQVLEAMEKDLVFNDGVVAARLAPAMNKELGKLSTKKDRGR